MFINYYDEKKFETKVTCYNGGKILRLDVTDVKKKKICSKCGNIMESRGKITGSYYDLDVDDPRVKDWKLLYIQYHHIRGYKCKKCQYSTCDKMHIPCKRQLSQKLKEKIAYVLWGGGYTSETKWNDLINEYKINDPNVPEKERNLITKSRINEILRYYKKEAEKRIESYQKLRKELIYYPFLYANQLGGIMLGAGSFLDEGQKSTASELDIYQISTTYSDEQLKNCLEKLKPRMREEYLKKTGLKKNDLKETELLSKVYVSPIYNPYCDSHKIINNTPFYNIVKGIYTELDGILRRVQNQKRLSNEINEKNNDIIEVLENKGTRDSFCRRLNAAFESIESEKLKSFYQEIHKSFQDYPNAWFGSISFDDDIEDILDEFELAVERFSERKTNINELLTKIMLEMSEDPNVIRGFSLGMEHTTKIPATFNFFTASMVMLRPVCDEYFIVPFSMSNTNYYLVIGYDRRKYCSYKIIEGKTPNALMHYFEKFTVWENKQVTGVYCPFDPHLIYSLNTILFNADFYIDLNELVDGLYDTCDCERVNALVATIQAINNPCYDLVDDPYPMEIPYYRSYEDILMEWFDNLDDGDKLDFEATYDRLMTAPELLKNTYLIEELVSDYPEAKTLIDIASNSACRKEFNRAARLQKIKSNISEAEELEGHRVLMGYADFRVTLQNLLNLIYSVDTLPPL